MTRTILKWLLVVALLAAAFLTAKHLDSNPIGQVPVEELPEESGGWQEYVQTDPEEDVMLTDENTVPAETEPAQTQPQETEPAERTFLITFAGDCTLGTYEGMAGAEKSIVKVVGDDHSYPFHNLRQWFEEDDFTLVNLEVALTDTGYPTNGLMSFRGPEAYAQVFDQGSVEGVSLANERVWNYGNTGYRNTCGALEAAGISYVERDSTRLVALEGGLTIGLYGTMFHNLDAEVICRDIAALRNAGADVVIVAAHWGSLKSYRPGDDITELAHAMVDAGADIVYGTHPHVLQPMERYGDGLILYSMGTICQGGYLEVGDYDTALVQVELTMEEDGSVSMGEPIVVPCSISSVQDGNNYQPAPYPQDSEGYSRVMSKLAGTWKEAHLANYG